MNLLVDKNTGEILAEHHGTPRWFNNQVGPLQISGDAVWLAIPADCAREDARVVLTPEPHIEHDTAARSVREAEHIAKKADKDKFDAIDLSKKLSNDDLDFVCRYLAARKAGG
jgi:hypothetical protein